jgi:hypothetical protein
MGVTCDLIINVGPALAIANSTTDFGAFTGTNPGKVVTFSVSLDTSVKLYIRTNGVNSVLNNDTALTANAWYTFSIIVRSGSSYTFRTSAACTVNDMVGVASLE